MCASTQRAREAGMAQSDFGRALAGAERRMERAAVELARTRRLLEREGPEGLIPFLEKWIPLEERYFDALRPEAESDLTVDTTGFFQDPESL